MGGLVWGSPLLDWQGHTRACRGPCSPETTVGGRPGLRAQGEAGAAQMAQCVEAGLGPGLLQAFVHAVAVSPNCVPHCVLSSRLKLLQNVESLPWGLHCV